MKKFLLVFIVLFCMSFYLTPNSFGQDKKKCKMSPKKDCKKGIKKKCKHNHKRGYKKGNYYKKSKYRNRYRRRYRKNKLQTFIKIFLRRLSINIRRLQRQLFSYRMRRNIRRSLRKFQPVLRRVFRKLSPLLKNVPPFNIIIRNLEKARKAANEASAIGCMRTLYSAQLQFRLLRKNGRNYARSLQELNKHGLIGPKLASGKYNGYIYKMIKSSSFSFQIIATPISRKYARRSFYVDETGRITQNFGKGRPDAKSQSVN